jgi:hypothetical protein
MSNTWFEEKRDEFCRDLLRDYCLSVETLERLFQEFDRSGKMVFEELRDLLGEEMNKGLLWRLKDTAHHLFRDGGPQARWANSWTGASATSSTNP